MLTCISNLLDAHSLAAVCETLARSELQDGALTAGERLAAVGWLQCEIRSAEQRSLLFEFDSALARLGEDPGDTRALDALANVRADLTRRWLDA